MKLADVPFGRSSEYYDRSPLLVDAQGQTLFLFKRIHPNGGWGEWATRERRYTLNHLHHRDHLTTFDVACILATCRLAETEPA